MIGTGRIDTHQHIVPPAYRKWLTSKVESPAGKAVPEWSPGAALDYMGLAGIETSILSVSTPGVEPGDWVDARRVAREVNEYAASIVAEHPSSFGFYATLTLPDVDGALAEAAYALDELKADGVVLLGNAKGIYLGDRRFDPLVEELNRRKTVVLVHPTTLPEPAFAYVPAYVADFLLDTTRAALSLARSGSLDRYPDLRIILSHAGGFLPFAATRVAPAASPNGSVEDGLRLLRKFYFDTALSASEFALPSLQAFADPGNIIFGSDWPYPTQERCLSFAAALDQHIDVDHHAVNRGNAEKLFPRFANLPQPKAT